MGHTKRFEIFFDNHIGLGIRWENYPYKFCLSIALIFFTMTIGLGEDMQDFKPTTTQPTKETTS